MAQPLEAAAIIGTLVLLEMVLAFDNAAILTVLSRRLPGIEERRRVLNYGLVLAYVLRIGAILGASVLIQHEAFLTIGGLYLLGLSIKHLWAIAHRLEDHQPVVRKPLLAGTGLSAFAAVLLEIALVDTAFALDAVVAAVGFTRDLWLIVVAAGFGLLALRIMAAYVGRIMDWVPLLEHMAYVAVGVVGGLLVLEHPLVFDHPILELSIVAKIGITVGLFAVPVLVKLLFKVPASSPGLHAATETDFDLHPAHRGEDVGPKRGAP